MHKPESIRENKTHKIFWDFEIQMDHLIPARRLDQVLINKRKRTYRQFCCSGRSQSENERKGKDRQIIGPCQRIEKPVEHEGNNDTNCHRSTWNGLQRLGKKTGGIGNQRKNQDHLDHSIVKIS